MEILKKFAETVNAGSIDRSLMKLGVDKQKLEQAIKNKKFILTGERYDIVLDYKPRVRYLNLYLAHKKDSKKLLSALDPNNIDFKSLVVFMGKLRIHKELFDIRLGAFGYNSSELGAAMLGKFAPRDVPKSKKKTIKAKTKIKIKSKKKK
jgi:hypothetical protein